MTLRFWNRAVVVFSRRFRLPVRVLAAAFLVSAVYAQAPKGLWVLQPPDQIVEYDAATFAQQRTLKVPRRVVEHPEYLRINAKGQMLFVPPRDTQWTSGEMAAAPDLAWFWDGQQAKEWKPEGPRTEGSGPKLTVTEAATQWFLSADGTSLFWLENKFEKITQGSDVDLSQRSALRVGRTELATGTTETIASLAPSDWCRCETGVCSESCPEWDGWAPDGVVSDFMLATSFTPGQLQTTYHESVLYQRSAGTWRRNKLPQPVESVLTASANGDMLITVIPDAGCCGWVNESSDQMLLVKDGKVSVIYDEYSRYNNPDYDVSFSVSDARLAAGNVLLAYTIVADATPDSEIRLSSGGKENGEELARVRRTIAELPAVEVARLDGRPQPATLIRHAKLVGWLSDREILVVQEGHLVVYDSRGSGRREAGILARSAADVFLR